MQQSHHLRRYRKMKTSQFSYPDSKPSRGGRLKSKAKKNKEKEPPLEKQKRIRNAWTQDEELLLAECFIQVSEDPKTGCEIKSEILFGTKSKCVQYGSEEKRLHGAYQEHVDGQHEVTNPDRLCKEEIVIWCPDEETREHFGDDDIASTTRLQRLAKVNERVSNSTTSSVQTPARVSRIAPPPHGGTIRVRPQSQNDRARERE
ncbi:hypothetical protein Tco_1041611 [Tanacetum coccineum]|uniref:Myb-like domain-containing protein n=1 Tax=Tanacetum coccineum TaxID=301880 RepID=A0ABQ5GH85_9ASTR